MAAAASTTTYMSELAELPGLARVNSQFTMKMVKSGGTLPLLTREASGGVCAGGRGNGEGRT
ncbi:MAG TPA: hypothetical protein VF073_08520 [Gaiella sp.]